MELLDGTLKLRHCTDLFTMRLPPWSLPRVGYRGDKRQSITPGHLLDAGVTRVKRSGLPKRHVLVILFALSRIQEHPTPRRWKRLRTPFSEGVGREVGVPRNLFPRLGVG